MEFNNVESTAPHFPYYSVIFWYTVKLTAVTEI
jgi:hypothetical protein